jgi:hypothetical protein
MRLNEVVYSVTLADVVLRFAERNPTIMRSFMDGTNIVGSIDIELAPASMNFKRADLQEAIATLRIMGKI